jgi:hypothetical protein
MAGVAGWQAFYLMTGGAAAVLTGLIFVALSSHMSTILAHPLYRDRAFGSVQALLGQVFLAAAVLVPSQPSLALGIEVGLVAAWFVVRTLWAVWFIRSLKPLARERPKRTWLMEVGAWVIWELFMVASSITLAAGAPVGLYLLAAAMVGMFLSNIWNAWVLIAEASE